MSLIPPVSPISLKQELTEAIHAAVAACRAAGSLPALPTDTEVPPFALETPRDSGQGDYSTNVALVLARAAREADQARPFAERIASALNERATAAASTGQAGALAEAEAGGGGYIFLRLRPGTLADTVRAAAAGGAGYGRPDAAAAGHRALVEFVSADPSGPLTALHGRGAAIGDAIAALLAWSGWTVSREFYVNDAAGSRQVQAIARAVFARYQQVFAPSAAGASASPAAAEEEDGSEAYIAEVARQIADREGDRYARLSTEEALPVFASLALTALRARQENTLATIGVRFDTWFSEQSLHTGGAVEKTLATLKEHGYAYGEPGGALWLRSTAFGDEADRALVRAEGRPTYLAGDLAYHADKLARGFDLLVDVWGADHAGYVDRTRAGLAALGQDPNRLRVVLAGPVRLLRDGAEVKTNGLTGNSVTLEELIAEMGGPVAARLFLLLQPSDTPLDLDADRARRQDSENPLYRLRGAAARLAAVPVGSPDDLASLPARPDDAALARKVAEFPDTVREAAADLAPDRIAHYALDLAGLVHTWLDRAASAAPAPSLARAAQTALAGAFDILGIPAAGAAAGP